MRLSRFILDHLEQILAEWENFARTLGPAADAMSRSGLRDHARLILQGIAADIETAQSDRESIRKSKGLDADRSDQESPAAIHGTQRQTSGFTLLQLTSEFRALRASVLRLWLAEVTELNEATSSEMVRFNEAIDEAVSESVVMYADQAAKTRDTFLAILGHDLRSPLQALVLAGEELTRPVMEAPRRMQVGKRVRRSVAMMTAMVNDLLEYARMQLGGQMPIARADVDLADLSRSAIDDARAAHPECPLTLETSGDLVASIDGMRLHQVLSNLLNNAAQYRDKDSPVLMRAHGEPDAVIVEVCNRGPVVPAAALESIFQPLVQLPVDDREVDRPATSVGLGLFIAREITVAHGGTVTVSSSEEAGTIFKVRLPRRPPAR